MLRVHGVMDEVVKALTADTQTSDPGRSSSDFDAFFAEQHRRLFQALALRAAEMPQAAWRQNRVRGPAD
jgi:hypothetical protein